MITIGFTGWQLIAAMAAAILLGLVIGFVWNLIDSERGTQP